MNIDRSTGLVKCGLCNRKFSSQPELRDHLPTHFGGRSSARPPNLLHSGIKHRYISHPGRPIKSEPGLSNGGVKGTPAGQPIKLESASFNGGATNKSAALCKLPIGGIKLEQVCAALDVGNKRKHAPPSKVLPNKSEQPFSSVLSESEPLFVDDAGDEDFDSDELEVKKTKKVEQIPGSHICSICNKEFQFSSYLKKHERMHSKCKYKCRYCTESFDECDARRNHERRAHKDVRLYKCSYCQKTFNYPLSLKNHIRIHTGEKPFECDVCKRKFTERGTMVAHRRVHFDETPYHCNLCDREFKFSSSLKAHKKAHEKVRPFQCDLCMNFYSSKKTLRSHRMKIHPEQFAEDEKKKEEMMQMKKDGPPFYCPACNNPFASKKTLRAHTMRIHSFNYNKYLLDKERDDLAPIINLGKQFGIDFSSSLSAGDQSRQISCFNSEPQQSVELSHTDLRGYEPPNVSLSPEPSPDLPMETTTEREEPPTEIVNFPMRRSLLSTDPKRRFKTSKCNAAITTTNNLQGDDWDFISNKSTEEVDTSQITPKVESNTEEDSKALKEEYKKNPLK